MVRVEFEILLSLRLGKCIQYKKQSKLMLTEMHLASYREYNRFPAHNSNMMWVFPLTYLGYPWQWQTRLSYFQIPDSHL